MSLLARLALLVMVGLPALGNAQAADAPEPSSQAAPPPPLVTAPPEPPPAEESPPVAQEPVQRPFRAQLLPPEWKSPRPDYTVPRIVAGTLLGTLGGAGGLVGGFLIGMQLTPDCDLFDDRCNDGDAMIQAIPTLMGTGLVSSLAVYGIGSALHGQGDVINTMLGGFAGTGAGLLLMVAVQNYGGILLMPPLAAVGAVIAYEMSDSDWERAQKAKAGFATIQLSPVLGVAPGGGVLGGVIGRF